MKIAIDIRDADGERTGKGFFSYGLVDNLLKLDPVNHYILYSDKPKSPFGEQANLEFRYINAKGISWHLKTLKDLKQLKPDLYFAPTSFIIPALAPKSLKTIITVHDLVAFLFPRQHSKKAVFIEQLTLKRALRLCSKVFVVSENTQNDLVKLFNYPKSQIAEIPCAPHERYRQSIDPTEAEKIRKKFKLPEKFILAVGTLEPRKNFANLIKSFVLVKRKFPDYKLVIVGKTGWKHLDINLAIKQYQLENEVIFPGYMKDQELHQTYSLATVFVFPSLYEGFGIPPVEAMASGCPVIASNVASLPEVVGDAGLLIDPKSSVKIADAIISLIESPPIRTMLIERGLKRSLKFSWKYSAQLALEAFQAYEPAVSAANPPENLVD